jgi:Protein of unknown function (DUF2752)
MPPDRTLPPTPPAIAPSPARRRVALLVAAIWIVAPLPVVLGLSSCPIARTFHVACPGCGMTRALELLLHGDLAASLAMHPLALPTALAQTAFALVTVIVTLRHGTPFVLWSTRAGRLAVYAGAAVFGLDVLLWLARAAGLMHGAVPV